MEVKKSKKYPKYLFYEDGRIESFINPISRFLKPRMKTNGYIIVSLSDHNGTRIKNIHVHRIIWEVFKGPIPENLVVDHIDGDRANNSIRNLRLLSYSENVLRGPNPKKGRFLSEPCRRLARILFKRGYTRAQVASTVGISVRQVGRYK